MLLLICLRYYTSGEIGTNSIYPIENNFEKLAVLENLLQELNSSLNEAVETITKIQTDISNINDKLSDAVSTAHPDHLCSNSSSIRFILKKSDSKNIKKPSIENIKSAIEDKSTKFIPKIPQITGFYFSSPSPNITFVTDYPTIGRTLIFGPPDNQKGDMLSSKITFIRLGKEMYSQHLSRSLDNSHQFVPVDIITDFDEIRFDTITNNGDPDSLCFPPLSVCLQ